MSMGKNRSISVSISTATLLIIALAVVLTVDFAKGLGGGSVLGGRTKVADVKTNKEVQELGRYSVEEYNRLQRKGHETNGGGVGDLKFSKVVAAEKQVVSGLKYYLKVAAFEASSGVPKTFDAEVVVKPGGHSKQLLHFGRSPATK